MAYDVFISYSREDSGIVDEIFQKLQENHIEAFIDREGISGGEDFEDIIVERIKESTVFLLIGSKHAYESEWVKKEFRFATNLKKPVIPYLIDKESLPDSFLFRLESTNCRNSSEHDFDTLVEDINLILQKESPKNEKEDLSTARRVASHLASSKLPESEKINMIISLAKTCLGPRTKKRIHEGEIYYREAYKLYKNSQDSSVRDRYSSVIPSLADILKEKNEYSEAAALYQSYIALALTSRLRYKSSLVECYSNLAEVQFAMADYSSAETNCRLGLDALFSDSDTFRLDKKTQRLAELLVKTLRILGRMQEADTVFDQIIVRFRNRLANEADRISFSGMLLTFAQSNKEDGNLEKAREYLQEAVTNNSNNIDIHINLAEVLSALHDEKEAFNSYETAFKLALMESGYMSTRHLKSALDPFVAFIDKTGDAGRADKFFKLALAKFRLDIYSEVISGISIGGLYEQYGDWLLRQKRYMKAMARYRDCLDVIDSYPEHEYRSSNRLRVSCLLAAINYQIGFAEKANNCIAKAFVDIPSGTDSKVVRWIVQVFKSWEMLRSKGYTEGAFSLQMALVEYSNNLSYVDLVIEDDEYLTDLGWSLLLMGEYEAAERPLEGALKHEKERKRSDAATANAKQKLARLYICTARLDKAEPLLKESHAVFQRDAAKNPAALHYLAETEYLWGRLMLERKKYDAAESYLESSLEHYREAHSVKERYQEEIDEVTLLLEKAKAKQEEG